MFPKPVKTGGKPDLKKSGKPLPPSQKETEKISATRTQLDSVGLREEEEVNTSEFLSSSQAALSILNAPEQPKLGAASAIEKSDDATVRPDIKVSPSVINTDESITMDDDSDDDEAKEMLPKISLPKGKGVGIATSVAKAKSNMEKINALISHASTMEEKMKELEEDNSSFKSVLQSLKQKEASLKRLEEKISMDYAKHEAIMTAKLLEVDSKLAILDDELLGSIRNIVNQASDVSKLNEVALSPKFDALISAIDKASGATEMTKQATKALGQPSALKKKAPKSSGVKKFY